MQSLLVGAPLFLSAGRGRGGKEREREGDGGGEGGRRGRGRVMEGERGEGEERERGIVIMHRYALVQPQLRHAVQTSLLKFHGPPQQQL